MLILESLVTSVDRDGRVNLAPMGPAVTSGSLERDDSTVRFSLRPFLSSRTYQNLVQTRKAVIHVTDDSLLFAQAAVSALSTEQIRERVFQLRQTDWWPLLDCHRWFAVEIDAVENDGTRASIPCTVIETQQVRPFFGFSRARHAVIEAAILATRTHLLSPSQIHEEICRLQPLVEKTGGPAEHQALELLRMTIDERLAARS